MTLDDAIRYMEIRNSLPGDDAFDETMDRVILSCLQELKLRRESEIRPATRFLGNSLPEQWVAICKEHFEVKNALSAYFKQINGFLAYEEYEECQERFNQHAAEELVDLQTACETMLAILGYDEQGRADIRRKVIEKNAARGYYEEAKP